jgi:sugar lactone lactonase YvrE
MRRFNQAMQTLSVIFICTFALTLAVQAADTSTEITLPGTRVFPESITSLKDGTLIIGSLGHGNILRIAPGKTEAVEWIKPGTGGLNSILGVFADEQHGLLWVCSNRFEEKDKGEATAAKTFDLKSGAPKGTYPLPGAKPLCNDFAVADDGTAYVSDTEQATIFMLKPGASALEVGAKDPLLAGADGLAFGDKTTLYVNSFTTNKFLRVDIGADGKAKSVTELKTPRKLDRPDGMRTIGKQRLLMAENGGIMSIITFDGPQKDTIVVKNLKEGMPETPAVTAARGMAWVAEGKLNYMDDGDKKGQDPGTFKMYAVPLPTN